MCDCPEPALCRELGRCIHGRIYELYKTDPVFRENFLREHNKPTVEAIRIETPVKEDQPLPSMMQQALNFSKAAINHVAHGMPQAPDEVYAHRLSLCLSCEYINQEERCTRPECGCPVRKKARWAGEKCPLNPPKWDVHKQEEQQGCGCGK